MTLHTRAATDDIYDIFNAPIKPVAETLNESADEYEYESDGDYTTDVESTVATRIIEPTENRDEEMTDAKSLSEWSEFSTCKHVSAVDCEDETHFSDAEHMQTQHEHITPGQFDQTPEEKIEHEEYEQDTLDQYSPPRSRTVFVPIPPEDYDPPTRPYRDPVEVANNRLPL